MKCCTNKQRKYLSILLAGLVEMSLGSSFAISSWNLSLKSALSLSQSEISLICSMASFGCYFMVIPGFLYDRMGPQLGLFSASILLGLTYLVIYIGIAYFTNYMNGWSLGILFFLIGQFGGFGVLAALDGNDILFGIIHRGKIMGILLCCYAAGGSIFAAIYQFFYRSQYINHFFKFLGIEISIICFAGFIFIYRTEKKAFSIPKIHKKFKNNKSIQHGISMNDYTSSFIINDNRMDIIETNSIIQINIQNDEIYGIKLFKNIYFWNLFIPVFIVIGSGLFITANISFILESGGGHTENASWFVILFGLGNCSGRLFAGLVSDIVIKRFSRSYFALLASILLAITKITFLITSVFYLFIPVILSGITTGIMFSIFSVIIRERFGQKHFGKNFSLIAIAIALGYSLFLGPISSILYESHIVNVNGINKCIGKECFRTIFLIIIGISFISMFCSFQLIKMEKKLNKMDVLEIEDNDITNHSST